MVMFCPVAEAYPDTVLAMPKSAMTARPSSASSTLSTLMSRWMTPASWANASARATHRANSTTSTSARGPDFSSRSPRVSGW